MAIVRLLLPLVLTAVMVFTIVDIIVIDSGRVKHLPKTFWIILAILLSFIGSILWFTIGREYNERPRVIRMNRPQPQQRRALAPDDDPAFLGRLERDRAQEERIKELERRLAELEDETGDDSGASGKH